MDYSSDSIVVLEGLEPVRMRPGMYIGDVHDGSGLHHILWELVANSVDEHLAGHASQMRVSVERELAEVEDDGRGIPVDVHPRSSKSAVEVILTTLCGSGTRDGHLPHVHVSPLHFGVGLSAVNAVCEDLEVEVRRDGYAWRQRYSRGVPLGPLERGERTDRTGTRIRIRPDRAIFSSTSFDRARIRGRLQELAYFNPGLTVDRNSERLREPDGLAAWVRRMAKDHETEARDVFRTFGIEDGVQYDVALAWTDTASSELRSYVGQNETMGGGTHERGFREGVVRAVAGLGMGSGRPARASRVMPRLRPGLLGIVHVLPRDARFGAPTRDRLCSPEARRVVRDRVADALGAWLSERPELARELLARIAS